ncbi:MAG: methyltransferase domain-containing protein [Pirellulales bacterium]
MQRETNHTTDTSAIGRFAGALATFDDGRHSPAWHCFDRRFRHDTFERFALTFERLGDVSGRRGLDVGCGSGHYIAEALRRNARHMVGIDPALGTLELARQRLESLGQIDQVELIVGYFPDSLPTGAFDFAIVMGVLDYVAEPVSFLRALRQVVNGRIVVSFPSKHWLYSPLRKLRYRLRSCSVYFYDEPAIRSIAERAGFGSIDVVKIDGAGLDFHACLAP